MAAFFPKGEGNGGKDPQHCLGVCRVNALFQNIPGDGPVHGSGVDERIPESLRNELGNGGFPGGGGSVNGNSWVHECVYLL